MALTIPAEPSILAYDKPPPGYRVSLVSFNDERKLIDPRLQLIHTNGAKFEGSIESSKNHAERRVDSNGNATTLPHFQVDRDGDAAMLLELNRWPIANARANPFSIAYETADTGWAADPSISAFTEPQLQKLANGIAYCSLLTKIEIRYPTTWDGNGTASHTEPFAFPFWTTFNGKICPGQKKKAQMRDIIMPHARKIVAAWTGVTPPPPAAKAPNGLTYAQNRAAGAVASTTPGTPTLQRGVDHDNNVPWLQQILCSLNTAEGQPLFNPLWVGVDSIAGGPQSQWGLFGDASHNALVYWQEQHGLIDDGVYGPTTATAMASVRGR